MPAHRPHTLAVKEGLRQAASSQPFLRENQLDMEGISGVSSNTSLISSLQHGRKAVYLKSVKNKFYIVLDETSKSNKKKTKIFMIYKKNSFKECLKTKKN